jgi:hypothetical protein
MTLNSEETLVSKKAPTPSAEKAQFEIFKDPESKDHLVTDIHTDLVKLGIKEEVARQIAEYLEVFQPLAFLGYGEGAKDTAADLAYEGRGVYHEVPTAGHDQTVYVKGIGDLSSARRETTATQMSGFQPRENDGFYEPRGTMYLSQAFQEYINSLVLFVSTYKDVLNQEGFPAFERIVQSGTVLPISVASLESVTTEMRTRYGKKGGNRTFSNRRYGSIIQLVPSSVRYAAYITGLSEVKDGTFLEDFKDPEKITSLAHAVKLQLEAGLIFKPNSWHLQNIYRASNANGIITADAADLIDLNSLPEEMWLKFVNERRVEVTRKLSKKELQKLYIAKGLDRSCLIPRKRHDGSYSSQDFMHAQEVFYKSLLPTDKAQQIQLRLDPTNHISMESIWEVAGILVDHYGDSEKWQQTTVHRESLLKRYKKQFAVTSFFGKIKNLFSNQFLNDIEANLSSDMDIFFPMVQADRGAKKKSAEGVA